MLQLPIYQKQNSKGEVHEVNGLRFNFVEEAELYQGIYALADSDSCDYSTREVEAIAKFTSYNFFHIEGLINRTIHNHSLSNSTSYKSLADRKLYSIEQYIKEQIILLNEQQLNVDNTEEDSVYKKAFIHGNIAQLQEVLAKF